MRLGLALAIICAIAAFALRPYPAKDGEVEVLGRVNVPTDVPGLGGVSALEISVNGRLALALSDRGRLFVLRLTRTQGAITAVTVIRSHRLTDAAGRPLIDEYRDTEGIARLPDGRLAVSFELVQQIRLYDAPGGPGRQIPPPPAFARFVPNKGLEALAADKDGRLYTLAELPHSALRSFAVWRWDGTGWSQPFHIPSRGFAIVAAEIGPDDAFYVLERRLTFRGFQSRLRRWPLAHPGIGSNVGEILWTSRAGRYDNLEGLSIRRDQRGGLIAAMASDNNFRSWLRSEIVELRLPLATGAATR